MTEVVFSLGIVVERDDDRFHAYSRLCAFNRL